MENGKNKLTTQKQFEKLVELMEKHPETGRGKPQFGSSKSKNKELWEEFALELNGIGPPSRTAQEWGRVWIHCKANLKRKLANNRRNYVATGGGPSQEVSLTPIEESVANLIKIREQVAPRGDAFGLNDVLRAVDYNEVEDTTFIAASPAPSESHTSNIEDRPTSSASAIQNRRRSKNMENERLELLKMQAQTQKDVLKKIEQLEKNVYKNYAINKQLLKIKKQKLKIYQKQAKERSELHSLKIEVQKLKIAEMRDSNNIEIVLK